MTYNLNEKEIHADDKINVFHNLLHTKDTKGVYLKEVLVRFSKIYYLDITREMGYEKIAKYWGLHFYHVQNFSMLLYIGDISFILPTHFSI